MFEIVNTVTAYRKISERELDAESDSDYFTTQTFSRYLVFFGALLCPSTSYFYGWMIPIYASKYFFLMYGTDTSIWSRFIKTSSVIFMVICCHYLITIRELRRFYQFKELLESKAALA